MTVTLLAESPSDEAAVRILARALLGQGMVVRPPAVLAHQGLSSVLKAVPAAYVELAGQPEVAGLIAIADSDDNPAAHVFGLFAEAVAAGREQAARLGLRTELNVAHGVATPCIEAWFLAGIRELATEAAFTESRWEESGRQLRNHLKLEAYGTPRPDEALRMAKAIGHATRLAKDLSLLEQAFPCGFGHLANDLRTWTS